MAKNMFEIECSLPAYYGYCYYHSGLKIINRLYIKNFYRRSVTGAYITITSAELLIDYKKDIELLPYERTLDIDVADIELNPQVLIDSDTKKAAKIFVRLCSDGILCENVYNITLLPYQSYPGVMAAAELLACFVKPLKESYKLLKSASDLMRGWKLSQMAGGYQGKSKDDIRLIAESLYRSAQNKKLENVRQGGIENPFSINFTDAVIAEKKATLIETACMFASCLEACGLNSAIAANSDECLLGVWLTDNCFLDSVFDDITEIKKRSDSIIDDIAVIDIKKLFENGTFSDAEKSASLLIAKNDGSYYTVIDIKRCRIANYNPLPLRKKGMGGYEVIKEERQKQDQELPQIKKIYKPIKLKPQPSKESQWERRLLDLSLKNRLLNFKPKSAIQIMSVSLSDTAQKLLSKKQYILYETPSEFSANLSSQGGFDTPPKIKPLAQLISLEQKNGRMRTFLDSKSLSASLGTLYRKEKTSVEETGTSALYAACGFLKWNYSGEKNSYKYAPLLLIPVTLEKKQGGKGFGVALREDEYSFNITLLEFLKQEFGIEMRGTANLKDDSDIESTFAAVKKMILSFKGWEVTEDVYIASLSYSSFLMWNDIHANIETFKKNKIIYSLTQNKLEPSLLKYYSDGDFERKDKETVYLPLSADNSQYKALRLSDKNVSFVLHGPPGTGKSQTITNIIANAIAKNKRVLFVAQKLAALSVVKKRLDMIGIGDFCLELHSLKTVKNEVCKKLLDTASLKTPKETDFKNKLKELKELKDTLKKPVKALHKTRRLGISIYQGIINVIENKDIPDDLMKIDSVFYDKLSAEKLSVYESLLKQLVAVSKECGQIYRSPFENVGITQYDKSLKKRIVNASKILQEESRHLNTYIGMFFELLGANVHTLTRKKLELLRELARMMVKQNNTFQKVFENIKADDATKVLNDFITIYKLYEKQEQSYDKLFKNKILLPAPYYILREELEIFPVDYYKSKLLRLLIKKINRAAKEKIKPENLRDYMETVLVLDETKHKTAEAGQKLSALISDDSGGKVNYNKVADFIMQLDILYKSISEIISNYDMTSFNVMLENMFKSYPLQIFNSFLNAFEGFEKYYRYFCGILKIERDYYDLDQDFLEYISLKAAALTDNIDMLGSWCEFNKTSLKLKEEGLEFVLQPLTEGKVSSELLAACFRKKVYTNFIEREISSDETLSKFSSPILEDKIEKFKLMCDDFEVITQKEIRYKIIERLPDLTTEGALSVELMQLHRAYKSNMRGYTIRNMISQQRNIFFTLAPCLLMSPSAVAQYLYADPNIFDLVVFDEASQIPTAEALGALSRSKNAVIVGDPKQLPPTSFFSPDYSDEEFPEYEDLESILEDCLALGLPERYLTWHYRSKHESLIAFSNAMYYGNRLCTFPSSDTLETKVRFNYIENGVYDRGLSRHNLKEAEVLIADIIKRLKYNPRQSIGVVTFSIAQQALIENKLSQELIRYKLESAAYEREEPVFVKNLESVQGDERDVILFSVCYGPDKYGRISMNFGPLNQSDGWRRLNVAASRAREEMVIYSSITSAMIDLSRNNSKGLAGIKAFLEFAQNGRSMLAVKSSYIEKQGDSIGKFIAADLEEAGYECRFNYGVSDFKIDVAVQGKNNKYILAVICDSKPYDATNNAKDAVTLQIKMLKRLNWNVMRIWTLNYYNNPAREIKRITSYLDKITGKTANESRVNEYMKPYTEAEIIYEKVLSYYILDKENEKAIKERLKKIIEAEQPINKDYLIKRCLSSYGIVRMGSNIKNKMYELCENIAESEQINGVTFYYTNDEVTKCNFFRVEESGKTKRLPDEISPYEYLAAAKSILTGRISLYIPDLVKEIISVMKLGRMNLEFDKWIKNAIEYGSDKGIITVSVNDMVTL